MTVEVRLFAAARAAAGTEVVDVRPGTLADICAELLARFPSLGEVLPRCSFLLDEVAVHGDAAAVTVSAGAQLDVLPPFAGG